jgi:hypothetical protein
LLCVALTRKRSHSHNNNNIAVAQLAGRRQWQHLVDLRKLQRLTGHRQINLMGRQQVSLRGHLQGRA